MSVAALNVIYGKALDERLTEQNAVLQECLWIAMHELAFTALPTSRQALRKIRERLAKAGIEAKS